MSQENALRIGFFFGIFAAVALWEIVAARRSLGAPKARRWASNLGIVFLNTFLVYWLLPVTAIGLAALSWSLPWMLALPFIGEAGSYPFSGRAAP